MNVKQQRNLIKVALFLARGKSPVRFSMQSYVSNPKLYTARHLRSVEYTYNHINECGTSCCFAGHGPLVLGMDNVKRDTTWTEYAFDTFGVEMYEDGNIDSGSWEYLFDASWDSDELQAAYRAANYLEHKGKVSEVWAGYYINDHKIADREAFRADVIKRLRKLQKSKLKDIVS